MSDKKVDVTIGDTISVSPESLQLKKDLEKVKWESDGTPFSIEIPGYPAPECRAHGKKYECVSRTFPSVGKIKYNVSSPGKPVLDPDLEIIP
jgi:hypothetical protein